MLKLIISKKETKRFQDIFRFFVKYNCELALFPEGLKYRNSEINGIIYKTAFFNYPIIKTKPLGKINPKIILNKYFDTWKELRDKSDLIEIPIIQ